MVDTWETFRARLAPHHTDSVEKLIRVMAPDQRIHALVLGGSLAHGFARPESDVDVILVVDGDEYQRRERENQLLYYNDALCTYPDGYVDGKYVDVDFLRMVADRGSDPARFAYQDAVVLFSRVPELPDLLAAITRYPVAEKPERIARFAGQLLAWQWLFTEATAKRNRYLEALALPKLVLFTCRIVLAANELLFPFHKWMLRVTETAPNRPAELLSDLDKLLTDPSESRVNAHVRGVCAFYGIDYARLEAEWSTRFLQDTELWWTHGFPSIDDL